MARRKRYRAKPPYYSQNGEDKWIVENLDIPEKGLIVEIGANDGIDSSNSLYFEQSRGWDAVCIEPDPDAYSNLTNNRNCKTINCAIGDQDGTITFFQHKTNSTLSGTGLGIEENADRLRDRFQQQSYNQVEVQIRTFQSIIDQFDLPTIDILSIDVEGAELQVLNSFDIDQAQPSIVIVEHDRFIREPIQDKMAQHQYKRVHRTRSNLIFVKEK